MAKKLSIKKLSSPLFRNPAMLIIVGLVAGLILAVGSVSLFSKKTAVSTSSPTSTPTSSPTASPTLKPTIKPVVTPKPVSCSKFEGGSTKVTIVFKSPTGSMVGSTVVRIKPTGSCPGKSAPVEQWLGSNQLTWTSPDLIPGTYRIEVANGNYQGVPAKTTDLLPNYHYTFEIEIKN